LTKTIHTIKYIGVAKKLKTIKRLIKENKSSRFSFGGYNKKEVGYELRNWRKFFHYCIVLITKIKLWCVYTGRTS